MSHSAIEELISVHLIENQSHSHKLLMKWTYPSITASLRSYIEKHSALNEDTSDTVSVLCRYRYYHYQTVWIYILTSDDMESIPNVVLTNVKQFAIAFVSKDFNPEKYETLAKLFSRVYAKTGDISKLLSYYLSILIHGSVVIDQNGTFKYQDFDQFEIMIKNSPIKSIINMFGLDIILIYTALILRKRIAVYHHKLDTLLQFVRSLPAFVCHHKQLIDKILYPCIELTSQLEIEDLKSLNHYIAGFLDNDIENRTDLYDIYVNLAAVEITVSHSAKDVFCMTKTHKEIAVFMSRQADVSTNSDIDVIKEINSKTNELIKTLKLMGGIVDDNSDNKNNKSVSKVVTLDALKQRKLAPNLESFLWNLAVAENLT